MSVKLGKRKRAQTARLAERSPSSSDNGREDLEEIFRKAFEKKFKPLEISVRRPNYSKVVKTSEDESDWEGVESEDERHPEEAAVEVIEVGDVERQEEMSKAELKAFMQSKPPLANPTSSKQNKASKTLGAEDEKNETLNLKNDLALHRLISESHLLSSAPASNHRSKVLDMRLQSLGSKTSFLEQEKMPLSHRKGMLAKGAEKAEKRRKEAKENGIILEKEKRQKVKSEMRVRGVGGPSVGKFKGGMLSLSKKDVADIRGPTPRGFKKKGKR